VALMDSSTTVPTVPVPASGRPAREAVAVPTADPTRASAPEVPKPQASSTSSPIGFALHYDAETQRLILEVREPVTGYVICQMPPKYVIKQFSTSASAAAPLRGVQVNSAV
jgi:hypothetical protein